jgi:hypothetical protein
MILWCNINRNRYKFDIYLKVIDFVSLNFNNSISSRTLILKREVATICTTCINVIEIFVFIHILYFYNFYPPESKRSFFSLEIY